ncbi:hypothetical protein VNI00_005425 [Paramarasmius palmivorus]|uniref:Uncharacterized protein n=1 Tax=Paramarasmius palmivorus TaxID=297713 RepID=A0AAW0DF98_9AGAR
MSMFVPLRALAHFQVVLEIPSTNIPDKEISYMLKPIPLSQAIASGDYCGSSGYLHVNAKSEGGILIVEVTTGNGSGSNSTPVPPLTTIPEERHEHSSAESTSYLVANPYSAFSNFALESEGNRISGAIGDTVIPKESPLSPNGGDVVRDDAACGVPTDWSTDNVGSLIGALSGFEYSDSFFPSAEYGPLAGTVEFDFGQSSSPGLDNRSETLSTTPLSSPETENPVSEQHIVQEEPRPKRYARNPRAHAHAEPPTQTQVPVPVYNGRMRRLVLEEPR